MVNDEARLWALGVTESGRHLTVVYTIRNGRIRVVAAHTANRTNRMFCEKAVSRKQQ
jgi:uncharacterized DUF497 family protein